MDGRSKLSPALSEGQQVSAGDLLAQIDHSQFKVATAQAPGQLAKDNATLANARRDLARLSATGKNQSGFPSGTGCATGAVNETREPLKRMKPMSPARLQLDWVVYHGPVSGRVGLKQVDVGNQISSSDCRRVVITQTHPIDLILLCRKALDEYRDRGSEAQKAGKRWSWHGSD